MRKIYYNQKQMHRALAVGLLTVIVGIAAHLYSDNYILTGIIGLGISYIAFFFYQKFTLYVVITANYVIVDGFFKKKMRLEDIIEIKYFAGDYIIKNRNKQVVIDTNLIDKESLPLLKQFVEEFQN